MGPWLASNCAMSSGSDCASAEAAAATLWCHETVAESAAAPVVQDGKGVVQKGSAHTILTEAGMAKVSHRKRFVSCVRKLRAAAA